MAIVVPTRARAVTAIRQSQVFVTAAATRQSQPAITTAARRSQPVVAAATADVDQVTNSKVAGYHLWLSTGRS